MRSIRAMLGPDAVLLNTEACTLESLVIDWQLAFLYVADIAGDLNFGASGWLHWNHVLLSGSMFPFWYGGPNHDNTTHFGALHCVALRVARRGRGAVGGRGGRAERRAARRGAARRAGARLAQQRV